MSYVVEGAAVVIVNRRVNTEGFARRLHHLAIEKTAERFTRWVNKHPNATSKQIEKARFDAAADTYLKAKEAGFDGDLVAWVKFVETAAENLNDTVVRAGRKKQ